MLTLQIAGMSPQHPPTQLPLITKFPLMFFGRQIQRVGLETQKAVYYIGCNLIVVKACIHLLSSQSLEPPTFDLFPLILLILSLERLGLMCLTLYSPDILFTEPYACHSIYQ